MKSRINPTLKSGLLLAGLGTALLVLAGGCPELNAATSDIRYVNMGTNIYMEPSEAVLDGVSSGTVSRYHASPYTTHSSAPTSLQIRNSDGVTIYTDPNFDVSDGAFSNVVSIGSTTTPDIVEVAVPRTEPQPGASEAVFHFVNGWQRTPAVDIYFVPTTSMPSGTPDISGLAYKDTRRFTAVINNRVSPDQRDLATTFDIVVCDTGTTVEQTRLTISPTTGYHYLATITAQSGSAPTRSSESVIRVLNFDPTSE